ncbi:unnamed protein product [Diatraea saccharalis]|uniref:Peroxisome assembly protein 12 n=1 Tax=Diatraea saccharalis TaxID=40085 RepID=A0A9P0C853_9NEOP|nr:unnamed protein product [Diatraea saccharalis]
MAVYAAHLTRTLQGTPSIFQVTAQEALGSTVKPALRKLVEYLAVSYPSKCDWCVRWFDELYLLLDACLQYHYLKHYAASFSESFYGLLRVPLSVSNEFNLGHHRLPDNLEKGSLILLVLVPYLREKVEKIIDRWREEYEDGNFGKSTRDKVRMAAIKLYSIVHVCSAVGALVQTGRYLTGAAQSPTLAHAALGLTLRDAPDNHDHEQDTWGEFAKAIFTGRFRNAAVSFPMVGGGLLRAMEYGAFLVQFLRWWDAAAPTSHSLPAPPPPHKIEKDQKYMNKCPVCLNTWRIPTVLPVSGYVYCYTCISRELNARGACPATGCPANARSLIRLYLS